MPGGLYYALIVLSDPTIVVPLTQYMQAASSVVSKLSTPYQVSRPHDQPGESRTFAQYIFIRTCVRSMIVHGDFKAGTLHDWQQHADEVHNSTVHEPVEVNMITLKARSHAAVRRE
ncbi:hypothetical protein EVJ58_g787 [Rhodofomes roseus]|uniref:Uncharacterized protein n=1 Tax=Rhodofomes roseus TaxID=34475 RepID=A0A4Y9Z2P8_9APHY|nr:hypothetical protein EVJ58_g787 [Rhodofomes roseus]